MSGTKDTMLFKSHTEERPLNMRDALKEIYNALKEKGYDPLSQLVGYVMSGDPTYITSYKNARSMIAKLERDEIIEELFAFYISEHLEKEM